MQLGDRGLPGQRHRERDAGLLARREPEGAADDVPVEDEDALPVAVLLVLGLHAGHQLQRDVLDVVVGGAADEVDPARQRASRPGGARVEDRVHRGSAHAEGTEQPLEHHRGVHSFTFVRGSSVRELL